MSDDQEDGMLRTVAPACKNQKYSIRQSIRWLLVRYYDKESRELHFNRIFRVEQITFETRNDKSTSLTWIIDDKICSTEDLIIIFKKDSTGFHRMYTISANERNYHFTDELHDDEHVIITTYHDQAFGLSELGKFVVEINCLTDNSMKFY
ncbi:unnamed protein product [Schistosoma margrebowiei]|uniref:Uncharacterized protein n=1 Tax=Schistosoma margrebowiei TaxID=48269 RepID=A0AA85AP21_9TREM|nr:unnamed protein product [Schistosoma margrebowiei]